MQNIATALEMYAADNDAYPLGAWGAASALVVAGDYMNPVPQDDSWTTGLVYVPAALGM